jgi:DNA-binding MarR family transcriptional regulator
MTDELGHEPGEVLLEFYALAHRHRLLMFRGFARHEMHPGQATCLRALAQYGELTQSELAQILVLSRPSVTRLLQRMERAELIRRRTDETDQRITRVELTDAGWEQYDLQLDVVTRYTDATLARFSEDDRRQLAWLLRAWRDFADEALSDMTDEMTDGDPLPDLCDDVTPLPGKGSTA